MTREEAIKELEILKEDYWNDDGYGHETKQYDDTMLALDMAIKALEQQSEDAISRAEAVRVASGYCHPSNIAKELAKLPSVQPKLTECEDAISREDALMCMTGEYIADMTYKPEDIISKHIRRIRALPPVQPKYNASEWCHDCSEYDQVKHCCPRYNKVIRNAVEEVKKPKTGHWILTDDDFVYCSECEDSYYPRPIDASWYYCPHCGAKMIEPQAESEGTDAGSN